LAAALNSRRLTYNNSSKRRRKGKLFATIILPKVVIRRCGADASSPTPTLL